MIVGYCRHCGNKCEWQQVSGVGGVFPGYPCATSGGTCEPEGHGDVMVRKLSEGLARKHQAGFSGFRKRRQR